MAKIVRLGEEVSPSAIVGGALGLVPFLIVAVFFWAAFAPPRKIRTRFVSKRG
jgi:hypothetical protein